MRPSIRRALLVLTAGMLTALAAASPVAAGTPLPVRHAVAIIRDPDISGIVTLLTTGDGDAGVAKVVFEDILISSYSVIASHQRCGTRHDPSSGRLSIISPRDPQSGLPTIVTRSILNLLPFIEQDARFSVRVFQTEPRREIACTDAVRYGDALDRPVTNAGKLGNFEIQDLMVTSFPTGMALLKLRRDGIKITASLPGLPDGKIRIVGDDVACGTAMTGIPPLSIYANNPGSGLLGVLAEPKGDAATIESLRLFKGTGTSRPAGCSGFDAVLVPR